MGAVNAPSHREVLERRNALWLTLRQCSPGEAGADTETFEQALGELAALIHWGRPRILAGLGLSAADLTALDDRQLPPESF